ncbi:MAG: methyl-accepting chemotaxis protein [Xenococcaceae cyanobacterium]
MASGTDYTQVYGQAEKAYVQGKFQEAATIINHMAEEFPDDPSILLLRGHICLGLQQYDLSREQYESVLRLTDKPDLIDCANKGLEQICQFQEQSEPEHFDLSETEALEFDDRELAQSNSMNWDSADIGEDYLESPTLQQDHTVANPFASETGTGLNSSDLSEGDYSANPFGHGLAQEQDQDWQEMSENQSSDFPFLDDDVSVEEEDANYEVNNFQESEDPTFVVSSEFQEMLSMSPREFRDEHDITNIQDDYSSQFDRIDDNLGSNVLKKEQAVEGTEDVSDDQQSGREGLLEELDLEAIPNFDMADVDTKLSGELFPSQGEDLSGNLTLEAESNTAGSSGEGIFNLTDSTESIATTAATNLTSSPSILVEPVVEEVKQGPLATFENASVGQKQWLTAVATGVVSALAVFLAGLAASTMTSDDSPRFSPFSKTNVLMTVVAGAASFGTTLFLGQTTANQIKRSTADLQAQFEAVHQGSFNAKATVYSKDEFGQLATGFNQMARGILTTTREAQRRAEETEQAREDLQRQVIRLLDDVEGAARGDLTVQAEVTADVLGAVADAFNLTIQNLREIVAQVKQAAQQVNKGSTDSESFARNQSSDALRMAEELAVTLNSVQMMTESIQRVAENAREAEEVARKSSLTAKKGGKAVERTVAGILQIRETVTETTRKVKRLAEASQEISTIVTTISQIASRTNLLALNASIQSAKAGEAGRGFAVVADEVRQLADRSAKSLKEIERIVLQIQTETGSVMTAMEEGLQQVIDVTERAKQAKGSLEDIIQVSNHIDTLVRSITADTDEQRENSGAVAQVMQSVELTAQETSQESQRVASALQNLVSIARDLLASVERFRVEANENK